MSPGGAVGVLQRWAAPSRTGSAALTAAGRGQGAASQPLVQVKTHPVGELGPAGEGTERLFTGPGFSMGLYPAPAKQARASRPGGHGAPLTLLPGERVLAVL